VLTSPARQSLVHSGTSQDLPVRYRPRVRNRRRTDVNCRGERESVGCLALFLLNGGYGHQIELAPLGSRREIVKPCDPWFDIVCGWLGPFPPPFGGGGGGGGPSKWWTGMVLLKLPRMGSGGWRSSAYLRPMTAFYADSRVALIFSASCAVVYGF